MTCVSRGFSCSRGFAPSRPGRAGRAHTARGRDLGLYHVTTHRRRRPRKVVSTVQGILNVPLSPSSEAPPIRGGTRLHPASAATACVTQSLRLRPISAPHQNDRDDDSRRHDDSAHDDPHPYGGIRHPLRRRPHASRWGTGSRSPSRSAARSRSPRRSRTRRPSPSPTATVKTPVSVATNVTLASPPLTSAAHRRRGSVTARERPPGGSVQAESGRRETPAVPLP